MMYKINIIVFLGLCSGYAHRLLAAQANDDFAVEKAVLNSNPVHKGEEVSSVAQKPENDVLEIYGHTIRKGAMAPSDYQALWVRFKNREKVEKSYIIEREEGYRERLKSFYQGEKVEKMLRAIMKGFKAKLEEDCINAICIEVETLEKKGKSKCVTPSKKITNK